MKSDIVRLSHRLRQDKREEQDSISHLREDTYRSADILNYLALFLGGLEMLHTCNTMTMISMSH